MTLCDKLGDTRIDLLHIRKERICRQHPECITLLDIRAVGQNDNATQDRAYAPGIVHSLLEYNKQNNKVRSPRGTSSLTPLLL